jgi:hypothetical protein
LSLETPETSETPEIGAAAEERTASKKTFSRVVRCGRPRVVDGEPCQQKTPCPWHADGVTPEDRSALARRGGWRARRVLPADTPLPALRSEQEVLDYIEANARLVSIGQLDTKISSELRGWAQLALAASELAVLERISRIEKVIRGRRVG